MLGADARTHMLDHLKEEHESSAVKLRELRHALIRYRDGGSAEFPEFAALVAGYAAFHWEHMRLEENDLLPLAERHLTDGDTPSLVGNIDFQAAVRSSDDRCVAH